MSTCGSFADLWQSYPELRMVRILLSPRDLISLVENDIISVALVVPDLQMTVDELFAQ